ncbi:MAG: sulfatase-like hydrolase/transferase, partial [Phycisphaeraceae bacterium]
IGFDETLTKNDRDGLADACVEFLQREHTRPFMLTASFINPHDICYWAINEESRVTGCEPRYTDEIATALVNEAATPPPGVEPSEFIERMCPPLPNNYEVPENEPDSIAGKEGQIGFLRRHNTEEDWRVYRRIYAQLTESVDAQIGRVLDALRRQGLEENTLVVFASDHGDMNGHHRLGLKSMFYEESARVPFIVSLPGVTATGRVDTAHPVAAGLDLIPTLCDFAGVQTPAGLPGRSVRPLAEGKQAPDWRTEVGVENATGGRMVRTARHKYCIYPTGERREQLMDLEEDPGEMLNVVDLPKYQSIRADLRSRLLAWMERVEDPMQPKLLDGVPAH